MRLNRYGKPDGRTSEGRRLEADSAAKYLAFMLKIQLDPTRTTTTCEEAGNVVYHAARSAARLALRIGGKQ